MADLGLIVHGRRIALQQTCWGGSRGGLEPRKVVTRDPKPMLISILSYEANGERWAFWAMNWALSEKFEGIGLRHDSVQRRKADILIC